MVVTFLSDYGLDDEFVGACKGVIERVAPGTLVIDVTHGIAPHAVLQGALVLADAMPHLPEGVHLAVVDPTVGGDRRAVVVRSGGRLFVGPDNGLLILAAEPIDGAWELVVPASASATFHGRDVFAPAAARLAAGADPGELGRPLDPSSLVRLELPVPRFDEAGVTATVLRVDRFGNLLLNLCPGDLSGRDVAVGRTFSEVGAGEQLLYQDSTGRLGLAVNGGSAAHALGKRAGDEVRLDCPRLAR